MEPAQQTATTLAREVEELWWYHTLELAPGVVTPGWHDMRPVLGEIPLPESLAGKRCLDVGTFDGYWAFEMERRGAAEVVAIDVIDPQKWDWPVGSAEETITEFAEAVLQAAGPDCQSEIQYVQPRRERIADDPQRRRPDTTRAQSILGWAPRVPLEAGLTPTLDYFKQAVRAAALA